MYLQFGNEEKPVEFKVTGGFVAKNPIAKIISISQTISPYAGTPAEKLSENLPAQPTGGTSLGLTYYKSYADFLAGESSVYLLEGPPSMQYVQTDESGVTAIYNAIATKLQETYEVVTVVKEK